MRLTDSENISENITSGKNSVFANFIHSYYNKDNVLVYDILFAISGDISNDTLMKDRSYDKQKMEKDYVANVIASKNSCVSIISHLESELRNVIIDDIIIFDITRAVTSTTGKGNSLYVWCNTPANNILDIDAFIKTIFESNFTCSLSFFCGTYFLDIKELMI